MSGEALQSATGADAAERAEQDQTPYLDAIVEYAERRPGRFHVPGHKGGDGADPAAIDALGRAAFDRDVPAGIEGIDVGPDSPFQQAQRLAAKAWGARRSWFLINGASQGNHATCLVLRHAGTRVVGPAQRPFEHDRRDHPRRPGAAPSSRPSSTTISASPTALLPSRSPGRSTASPDAVAALTVSPTYFGAVADVAGLAEVCHERNLPLVVDEAWGAHLRFSPLLPASALECGADLVLSSVHKLVGSLTQSAILHLGPDGLIDEDVVDRCVTLTESTSPSALLTASLDAARRYAAINGPELLAETLAGVERARAEVQRIPGSTCSTSDWSVARECTAGTRCASRSTSASPAAPAPGSPR